MRKRGIRCPVDIRPGDAYVDRNALGDRHGPIDARRDADVLTHVTDVQRQVAADEPAHLVAVVEALNGLERAEYEQAAQHDEDRNKAERQRARQVAKHRQAAGLRTSSLDPIRSV